MGYDMRMVGGTTEAEQAALDAVQDRIKAVRAKLKEHGFDTEEGEAAAKEFDRLIEEQYELPSDYYRLNIFGMGWCRGFMEERGMVYEARGWEFPDFEWPKKEDFENTDEYDSAYIAAETRYEELSQPILEHHPEGGDGIPSFKLGSNDGWHVTEAECAAAVAAAKADGTTPTVLEDGEHVTVMWWQSWVDYLDRASRRGGFHVH